MPAAVPASAPATPTGRRTSAQRLLSAAVASVAAIPRQQSTPNMPRLAVAGTLLGIHLDVVPTQSRPARTTGLRRKADGLTLTDFFSGGGGTSVGALNAGLGAISAYNHWPEAVACHAENIPGQHFVADLNLVADLAGTTGWRPGRGWAESRRHGPAGPKLAAGVASPRGDQGEPYTHQLPNLTPK